MRQKKPNKRDEERREMKRVVATFSNYDLGNALRSHAPCVHMIGANVETLPTNKLGALALEAARRLMRANPNPQVPMLSSDTREECSKKFAAAVDGLLPLRDCGKPHEVEE